MCLRDIVGRLVAKSGPVRDGPDECGSRRTSTNTFDGHG
jgi:hypothetical protein